MHPVRSPVESAGGALKKVVFASAVMMLYACTAGTELAREQMQAKGVGLERTLEAAQPKATKAGYAIRNDDIRVWRNSSSSIGILDNDTLGVSEWALVEIVSGPFHGTARIGSDQVLKYAPETDYVGFDQIGYKVTQYNQANGTAYVDIRVDCRGGCLQDVRLDWAASTSPGIKGYYIHHRVQNDGEYEKIWVGKVHTYIYPVKRSARHEFSITALATDGQESSPSETVVIFVP